MRHDKVHEAFISAGSIIEADVMVSALNAAGIEAYVLNPHVSNTLSHLEVAINPKGVRIVVPSDRLEEAIEIVGQKEVAPAPADERSPHEDAVKAMRCTYFMVLFPPLAFIGLYFGVRSAYRSRNWPGPLPKRTCIQVMVSILLSVLVITLMLFMLISHLA